MRAIDLWFRYISFSFGPYFFVTLSFIMAGFILLMATAVMMVAN